MSSVVSIDKYKCPCGQRLPVHLLDVSEVYSKHVCSCHRLYQPVDGAWKHVGMERNGLYMLEAVKNDQKLPGTQLAPSGHVWLCPNCFKLSLTRYGYDETGSTHVSSDGWDTSCASHAVLCKSTEI